MKFTIEDNGPVVGLADLIHELYPADGYYEELLLEDFPTPLTLAVAAERAGIGPDAVEMALLDASRFSEVMPRRQFSKRGSRRLATWLHLATPEQLPRELVKVPWFASHAPRGGRVRAQHTTRRSRGGTIGLNVFGSTLFRAGRSFAVTAYDDTGPRKVCSMSSLILEGTPTRYHYRGKAGDWELEDLVLRGKKDEDLAPCSFCSIRPGEIDLTEHDADPPEDRRETKSPHDFGNEYEWKKRFAFSVPIPLPLHLPIPPPIVNIGFVATTAVTWKLDWTLAGGYRYQAYWRKERAQNIPPMWAAEP